MVIYLIIFILFYLLGSILSKYFFITINKYEFSTIFGESFAQMSKKYILVPLLNYSSLKEEINKRNLKKRKFFQVIKLSLISEIFGGVIFGLLSISIINSFNLYSNFSLLIYLGVTVAFTSALLYLAIYDVITFTIPENLIKLISFVAILVNLVVGSIKLISENIGTPLLSNLPFGDPGNLISGVFFALLIWAIVKITKEKGMGEGDVYLVLIIGLILGWPNTLISFLSTLILGSIISLAIAGYLKKLKGVIVPFVPFLLLGFVVALSFGKTLSSFLFGV